MCRYHRCQGPEAFPRELKTSSTQFILLDLPVVLVLAVAPASLVVIPEGDLRLAAVVAVAVTVAPPLLLHRRRSCFPRLPLSIPAVILSVAKDPEALTQPKPIRVFNP
jgi:hypothetical protein